MQIDLASIPANAKILAAEMVLIRTDTLRPGSDQADPAGKPTMWVAEACNRPWNEEEINGYQYDKDKFWKAAGGMDWSGSDPDFLPLYLAYGPSQGNVNTWDFTEAVKYWTNPANKNHGFFWHCTPKDFWTGSNPTREAANIKDRPALMVIYAP